MVIHRAIRSAAVKWARPLFDIISDAVFPAKCLICYRLFHPLGAAPANEAAPIFPGVSFDPGIESYRQLTAFCCSDCRDSLNFVSSPICVCCGVMFKARQDEDHLCGDCVQRPKNFRMARASLVYDHQLMAIIHRFKYAAKTQLARPLGGLMLSAFLNHWAMDEFDLIMPVPLHSQKFRKRGFNQSYLLINSWKASDKAASVSLATKCVNKEILVRNKATGPQTGLGRQQRLENIRGAFSVRFPDKVHARKILVVDDVYTTGATVNECARVLLEAGAQAVDVLTLARTMVNPN